MKRCSGASVLDEAAISALAAAHERLNRHEGVRAAQSQHISSGTAEIAALRALLPAAAQHQKAASADAGCFPAAAPGIRANAVTDGRVGGNLPRRKAPGELSTSASASLAAVELPINRNSPGG